MTQDPARLLEDSELNATARSVLEAAQLGAPVAYDLAKGEARLHGTLASAPQAIEPDASASPSSAMPWLKLLMGLSLGLMLPFLGYRMWGSAPASSAEAPAPLVVPLSTTVGEPLKPVVSEILTPHTQEIPPLVEPATSSKPRKRVAPAPRSANQAQEEASPASDPRAELRAVARAKALLERDPRATLALLEQMRGQFPQGFFIEERQALHVLALVQVGERERAQREGRAFLAHYPNGTHSDRVHRALSTNSQRPEEQH